MTQSASQERSRLVDQICTLYVSYFLTHVREIFAFVFNPGLLAKSLGISLLDFMKLTSKDSGLNVTQINAHEETLDPFRWREEQDDPGKVVAGSRERISFQEGSPAKAAFSTTPVVDHASDDLAAVLTVVTPPAAVGIRPEGADPLIIQTHETIEIENDSTNDHPEAKADDQKDGKQSQARDRDDEEPEVECADAT